MSWRNKRDFVGGCLKVKKLLMLNGSHSEIPLINAAKQLGYYVITSGNNPSLIGHSYANQYIYADYSNEKEMLRIAKENSIDAVCSCANDFGAITAAYIAEQLDLPGHDSYDTAKLLHQKNRFKEFARENSLQTPLADIYSSVEEATVMKDKYEYPVIVKPVDLTGGKGVSKVNNAQEYACAVQTALCKSIQGKIVVEKFINGTYHSFSTFLLDKKVIAYYSDNEYSYCNPYFVATSGGPARDVMKVKDVLVDQAEIIAQKLQLVNGVFHMQYVMSEGKPYIIDITRRCSGDIYTEPVEHATGIAWAKWIVMAECGFDSNSFKERGVQTKYCGRHCLMAERNGVLEDVIIDKGLEKNIYKKITWWKKGDVIKDYLVDKLGILFLEYESEEEMLEKIAHINELIRIKIN